MYKISHSQAKVMPRIDLTRLKSMTEEDWRKIVIHVPFLGDPFGVYLDYTDSSNLGRTNWVFRPRVFKTAKEAGMTMLRTLNFTV